MVRSDDSSLDWAGILVRGICGAVLGAVIGVSWILFDIGEVDPLINWAIFVGAVVVFAFLSIRYGDDFWMNLREWLRMP